MLYWTWILLSARERTGPYVKAFVLCLDLAFLTNGKRKNMEKKIASDIIYIKKSYRSNTTNISIYEDLFFHILA